MNKYNILYFTVFVPIVTMSMASCDEAPELSEELGSQAAPLFKAPPDVRIPGEYLVVFADNASASTIAAAADRIVHFGAQNHLMYRYSTISGFAARLDDAALDVLRHNPDVAYIEENQQIWLSAVYDNPPDGIDRTDQRLGHDSLYDDHGRTGAGVHVYVLDTGINTQHAEFTGRIGNGFTAIADGRGIEDCHGHGSHVSSTAAGTSYGMARQASIHPVRVLDCAGSGSWAGAIAGVDFVRSDCLNQNGVCVANMSLSGSYYAPMNQAVANAVDSGVTFVVAAGNDNQDACNLSPASEPKAITVAAMDDFDRRASFSNWGSCVDIFAPGVSILGASIGSNWATATLSGTSMASPHVAGAVAQYLGSNPAATPAQVEAGIAGAGSVDCVGDPQGSPNLLLFNDLTQDNYFCSHDRAIVTGVWHTCALDAAGAVRCWGYNTSGQLGYGHTQNIGDNELPSSAGDVSLGGQAVQVDGGGLHTCALLDTGAVRCWGQNYHGQLGYGHTQRIGDNELPSSVGPVSLGDTATKLISGYLHSCALLGSGGLRCWGNSQFGQLGYGNTVGIGDNELPSSVGQVSVGGAVEQMASGLGTHTCVRLTTGAVRCWGQNHLGQLGHGHTQNIGDNELPSSAGDVPYE